MPEAEVSVPAPDRIAYRQVDAFTRTPYQGNPAAVCVVDQPLSASVMQAVAAEMNLSETAFVEATDASGVRPLRWFTPTTEVPLCGHATLASGHALRSAGHSAPYRFGSASGRLTVHAEPDGALRLDFPADACTPVEPDRGVLEALGLTEVEACLSGTLNYIVRVETSDIVDGLKPNFSALGAIDLGEDVLVLTVTARDRGGSGPAGGGVRRLRHRLTCVRGLGRHRRGPRDRGCPHRPRALLGRRAGQAGVHGPTGRSPPRPTTRPHGRRPGPSDRACGDGRRGHPRVAAGRVMTRSV